MRQRITKLSGLLRLADGLDRGHVGSVSHVKVRWSADVVRVHVVEAEGAMTVRLECWGGARKRGLLEEVLGRPVEVIMPDGSVASYGIGEGE